MTERPLWQRAQRKARRAWLVGGKAAVQGWRSRGRRVPTRLHVFVAGAQRSGTNMLMGLLERSYETAVFHERDSRAFDHYLMRDPDVIEQLARSAPAPVFVIKALCEMDRLPMLADRFAPAKILWSVRHYENAVASSLRSFTRVASKVSDLVVNPDAHGWMGRGMSEETHAVLRDLHHPSMNDASRVALFWYLRNRLLFDTGLDRDPRTILVRYEEVISQPDRELERVFSALDLRRPRNVARYVAETTARRGTGLLIDEQVRRVCDALLMDIDDLYGSPDLPWLRLDTSKDDAMRLPSHVRTE